MPVTSRSAARLVARILASMGLSGFRRRPGDSVIVTGGRSKRRPYRAGLAFASLLACSAWVDPLHPTQEELLAGVASLAPAERALLATLHVRELPRARPARGDAQRGKRYFFDGGFAADGRTACSTCHDPARAFASDRVIAARNAPTLLGAGSLRYLNWDGSADSARAQALGPLTNPAKMASNCDTAEERVRAVYGRERDDCRAFLADLEAYVVGLEAQPSRFDVFAVNSARAVTAQAGSAQAGAAAGTGSAAFPSTLEPVFSKAEAEGLALFLGKGRCVRCHHGPLLSDGDFHNAGVPVAADEMPERAAGRIEGIRRLESNPHRCETCADFLTLPRGKRIALGAFKTPTLRELEKTAPYMHNGIENSLRGALEHYVRAPEAQVGDTELEPVPFTEAELDRLEAFVRTLSNR